MHIIHTKLRIQSIVGFVNNLQSNSGCCLCSLLRPRWTYARTHQQHKYRESIVVVERPALCPNVRHSSTTHTQTNSSDIALSRCFQSEHRFPIPTNMCSIHHHALSMKRRRRRRRRVRVTTSRARSLTYTYTRTRNFMGGSPARAFAPKTTTTTTRRSTNRVRLMAV